MYRKMNRRTQMNITKNTQHFIARAKSHIRSTNGFTLVELIVVIAILVLLASIVVPQLFAAYEQARLHKIEIDSKQILAVVDRHELDSWLKTGGERGALEIELTTETLADDYLLDLSDNGATFAYSRNAAGKSHVEATIGDRVFRTDTGWDNVSP